VLYKVIVAFAENIAVLVEGRNAGCVVLIVDLNRVVLATAIGLLTLVLL
jgi:hypothetical protein